MYAQSVTKRKRQNQNSAFYSSRFRRGVLFSIFVGLFGNTLYYYHNIFYSSSRWVVLCGFRKIHLAFSFVCIRRLENSVPPDGILNPILWHCPRYSLQNIVGITQNIFEGMEVSYYFRSKIVCR